MKKSLLALAMLAALTPLHSNAQTAAAPAAEPASPLAGNLAIVSDYRFRGISQSYRLPAVQGGIDYAHSSGFYLGNWNSSVSGNQYPNGASLEMDFYGGFKGSIAEDIGFDVGLLQYYYPGDTIPGATKADTLEMYGAITWKWLSAKYSYSLKDKTFGVTDSKGTYYLDLTANFPVTDKLTFVAHYGKQKFSGSTPAGVSNDSFASYDDYKLGLSYTLPKDFTIGAFYTDTKMDALQEAFYTTPAAAGSRMIGKDTFTLFVSKTF